LTEARRAALEARCEVKNVEKWHERERERERDMQVASSALRNARSRFERKRKETRMKIVGATDAYVISLSVLYRGG